jgi:hexosaminidase
MGISPTGNRASDERYSLTIDEHQVLIRAAEPIGVARGLTTLIQLLATGSFTSATAISLPRARILDAPRYAWRGLSLDVARCSFTVAEVCQVIDLLALYKFNVLHLHLTDDQGWRLPESWSGASHDPAGARYSEEDVRRLVSYADDRFITLVPEIDMPGHASALMRMHPALNSGRNRVESEFSTGWLDPELPATFDVVEQVLAGVSSIFTGPYIHIGGDELRGMPHDLYSSFVQRARALVRSGGKRPLGWQESARAGLSSDDVIQYWFSDAAHRDLEMAVTASAPVILSPLSHCYLNVRYTETPADREQAETQSRVGSPLYSPMTVAEAFDWEPSEALGPGRAAHVAGVEAAIRTETISSFDDLGFLLLPRLVGIAEKAWRKGTTWAEHRHRLARHGRLWAQDGLTYFRASTVDCL